jgi:CRP-like cAMP-binding protein
MRAPRPLALHGDQFASLSEQELHALGEAMISRPVSAGATLASRGADAAALCYLSEGWAFRHQTTRNGSRQISGLALPGDFANLDVLAFAQIDYGVRMLTAGTIFALPRDGALALGERYPGIAAMFARQAFVENAILSRWTLCLGRMSAAERLAHLLCEVAARLGHDDLTEQPVFDMPLTQEQLADALGLTAVHVNRMLQQLRGEGLIATRGRSLTILLYAMLRARCDYDPAYLHREESRRGHALPSIRTKAPALQEVGW